MTKQKKPWERQKQPWMLFLPLLIAALIYLLTVLILHNYTVTLVVGHSMEPQLSNGELTLVGKGAPGRGDVRLLDVPQWRDGDQGKLKVKQAIALPGDQVSQHGNRYTVTSPVGGHWEYEVASEKNCVTVPPFTLKAGEYLFLGANRNEGASIDSLYELCLTGDLDAALVKRGNIK